MLPSKLVAVALATVLVACTDDATEPSHAKRQPDATAASDNPHQADGGRDASVTGFVESGPGDGGSASGDRLDGDVPTIEVEVTVRENPQNPLSVFVEWETSSEGTTFVRVECDVTALSEVES